MVQIDFTDGYRIFQPINNTSSIFFIAFSKSKQIQDTKTNERNTKALKEFVVSH